jgi:electron transport complex protein RnfA
MNELLLIALTAAVVNNLVLDRHRADTAHADVRGIDAALALAAAAWLALLLATATAYAITRYWLAPLDGEHFALLVLLVACAVAAALIAAAARTTAPRLARLLRDEAPLVAASSALLGSAVQRMDSGGLAAHLLAALGAGLVFVAAQMLLAGLCERLDRADIPLPLRGPPIILATAGLLSLAFLGFTGIAGL